MGFFSSDENKSDGPGKEVLESQVIDYIDEKNQSEHILFNTSPNMHPILTDSRKELNISSEVNFVICITQEDIKVILSGGPLDEDVFFEIPFETIDGLGDPKQLGIKFDALVIAIKHEYKNAEFIKRICAVSDVNQSEMSDFAGVIFPITDTADSGTVKQADNYLRKEVTKSKTDAEIIKEAIVGFYNDSENVVKKFDMEANKGGNFVLDTQAVIRLNKNSMSIGGSTISYDDVANVKKYKYVDSAQAGRETPELLSANYKFTDRVTKRKGIELTLKDGTHISIYEKETKKKSKKSRDSSNKATDITPDVPEPDFPYEVLDYIQENIRSQQTNTKAEYTLVRPFDPLRTELQIEGWTDGSSQIQGDITADSETKGKSRGISISALSQSKITTESALEGELSGAISDNTFSSKVICLKLYDDRIVIDSKMKIDLFYSDIKNVFQSQQREGIVIEAGSKTFRVEGIIHDELYEASEFLSEKIKQFEENDDSPSNEEDNSTDSVDKIRELKQLHEDGILTDEEFQSKKEELLEDF